MPRNVKRLCAEEALHLILETTDQDLDQGSDSESSDVDILSHYDPPAPLGPVATKIKCKASSAHRRFTFRGNFHNIKFADIKKIPNVSSQRDHSIG